MKNRKKLTKLLLGICIIIIIYIILKFTFPNIFENNYVKSLHPALNFIFSGLVIYSIYFQAYSIDEEFNWRKKHTTFEYLRQVRPIYNESFLEIKKAIKNIDKEKRLEVLLKPEVRKHTKLFLSNFEYIAVGVNNGIFDINIISQKSGSYIIGAYHNFLKEYIEYTRQEVKTKKGYVFTYSDFINLVKELEKIQKKKIENEKKNINN